MSAAGVRAVALPLGAKLSIGFMAEEPVRPATERVLPPNASRADAITASPPAREACGAGELRSIERHEVGLGTMDPSLEAGP